jgi:hypothetical protein
MNGVGMAHESAMSSNRWCYSVRDANVGSDGTIIVPGTSSEGMLGVLISDPDEDDYEFWLWVVANRNSFPEINHENAAAVANAFEQTRT